MNKKAQIELTIVIFLAISFAVALVLFPTMQSVVNDIKNSSNLSGGVENILDLVPLFLSLIIVGIGAIPVIIQYRKVQ